MSIASDLIPEFDQEMGGARRVLRLLDIPVPGVYGPSADEA